MAITLAKDVELNQSKFLKGTRKVRLMPDDTLSVAIKANGTISEYSVPLSMLDDSPVRTKQPPSKFIFGAVISGFIFLGLLFAQVFAADIEIHILLGVLAFLALIPFGFSLFQTWRLTYDITTFYYKSSNQIAFTVFTDKPDTETFKTFMATLVKQIKSIQTKDEGHSSDSVAAQLQSFAKLKEQGILTDEEFQSIKTRLIAAVAPPSGPVGFGS